MRKQTGNLTDIQWKQKLLHYKAELDKYKKMTFNLNKRIQQFENEQEMALSNPDPPLLSGQQQPEATGLFDYAIFMPEDNEAPSEILVTGHFHMINTGGCTLTNPYLAFRITPAKGGTLNGKISVTSLKDNALFTTEEEWAHMRADWKEKKRLDGEYWLQPQHCSELNEGEKLTFSHFDLRIDHTYTDSAVKLEGFCFSAELPKGTAAKNSITFY